MLVTEISVLSVAVRHKKGVFYFGHAETVVPVLVALGLFNDGSPLMAANFGTRSALHRKFCVSRISPFAVNVALVLHEKQETDCESDEEFSAGVSDSLLQQSDSNERYVLELLFKEQSVKFPFANRLQWPYSEVRRKYDEYISGCEFHKRCTDGTSVASSSSSQFL